MAARYAPEACLCAIAVHRAARRRCRQNEAGRHCGRELHVIQDKTGAELYLPVVPELVQAMKAYPAKGLSLIGNENGKPLSRAGLSPTHA